MEGPGHTLPSRPLLSPLTPLSSPFSLVSLPLPIQRLVLMPLPHSIHRKSRHERWNGLGCESATLVALHLTASDWRRCARVSKSWNLLWLNLIRRFQVNPRWNRVPPELVPFVARYLKPHDRVRSLLVSRTWHILWLPHLWGRVILEDEVARGRFYRQETQASFHICSHSLRFFSTCQGYIDGARLLAWPHNTSATLQELKLDFHRAVVHDDQKSCLDLLVRLLQRLRQLRYLTLIGDLERLTAPQQQQHQDIRASFVVNWIRSSTLQSLTIDCRRRFPDTHHQVWDRTLADSPGALPALKHMSLSGSRLTEIPLLSVLKRFPSLEELEIHSSDDQSSPRFFDGLQDAVPNLVTIIWDSRGLTDLLLSKLLGASSRGWREVSLAPSGIFGPLSQAEFMRHSNTIKKFVVEGLTGLSSDWIEHLLESATNLQCFQGFPMSRPNEYRFDLCLDIDPSPGDTEMSKTNKVENRVEEGGQEEEDDEEEGELKDEGNPEKSTKQKKHAIDKLVKKAVVHKTVGAREGRDGKISNALVPWACKSLRYLALRIDGLPRTDFAGDSPIVQWHIEDLEQEPQRRSYSQLGSLTNLRELVLGHGSQSQESTTPRLLPVNQQLPVSHSITAQFNCLSFSLSSGLDILSNLKFMTLLDVSNTAHKIGVKELWWFHMNWPMLKVIVGLLDRVGVSIPEKERVRIEKAVRAWLAIYTKGIGSWYYYGNKPVHSIQYH